MDKTCSAVIPFYNEGTRILPVLDILTQVSPLSEIVCIDDGSTDTTASLIKTHFKNVVIVSSNVNAGKSAAVLKGIQAATGEYIFLCDGDLRNLRKNEIEKTLGFILQNPEVDMVIMRRVHDLLRYRLLRGDVLHSGERVLKQHDLLEIFKTNPVNFQLEVAINSYMLRNKKKVYWTRNSAINCFQVKKNGFFKGMKNEFNQTISLLQYENILDYSKTLFYFCTKPITGV